MFISQGIKARYRFGWTNEAIVKSVLICERLYDCESHDTLCCEMIVGGADALLIVARRYFSGNYIYYKEKSLYMKW